MCHNSICDLDQVIEDRKVRTLSLSSFSPELVGWNSSLYPAPTPVQETRAIIGRKYPTRIELSVSGVTVQDVSAFHHGGDAAVLLFWQKTEEAPELYVQLERTCTAELNPVDKNTKLQAKIPAPQIQFILAGARVPSHRGDTKPLEATIDPNLLALNWHWQLARFLD